MNTINPIGTALVVLVAVLLVFGALFGTVLAGTEVWNPASADAKARQTDAETANLTEINKMWLPVRAAEAHYEASMIIQKEKIDLERMRQQWQAEQTSSTLNQPEQSRPPEVLTDLVSAMGYIFLALIFLVGCALVYVAARRAIRRLERQNPARLIRADPRPVNAFLSSPQTQGTVVMQSKRDIAAPGTDPWQSAAYRQTRRDIARQRELYFRQLKRSTPAMPPFFPGSFNSYSYQSLIDERDQP
jgi:hypothetical protein